MAPNRGRNRASEFETLANGAQKDNDPEIDAASEDSDGSADTASEEYEGREHYVNVGKSKLRKPKTAPLGPRYRGSRISRDDVEDEEEDNPFDKGFEDGDSEDDVDVLDVSGAGQSSNDEEEEETNETDTDDETPAGPQLGRNAPVNTRSEMLKAAKLDQKSVASSLSQSVKSDAEKGRAVKRQKSTFDALLGARIKLQKSLVATNTIMGLDDGDVSQQREEVQDAMEAAETAAFNLWSSLNDFRDKLNATRTGEKRKRGDFAGSTPTEKLWTHMQEQEVANLPHRNVVLQRWSTKTRGPGMREQGALVQKPDQTPIIASIKQYLKDDDHLLRKAHTPRSCAPLQADQKVSEDIKIYDDADFYGLMLKELLESKASDTMTSVAAIDFDPRREAKTKKHVDTKASKGRKLRYTVHDKLQNFMPPEDRRRWGDRQADELFGSLFGRRLGLGEDVDGDGEGDAQMDDNDVQGGDEGLMLFKS